MHAASPPFLYTLIIFSAWQYIWCSALCAISRPSVRPSVCLSLYLTVGLSVTQVDQSKAVEVRIGTTFITE